MNAHHRRSHLWKIAAFALILGAVTIRPAAAAPGGSPTPRQHAYTGCGGAIAPLMSADFEQQLVELINDERAKENLPPLKQSSDLTSAARYHGTDLGQDNYFKHDTYDQGGNQWICGWNTRIGNYYANRLYIAENLAAGQATPAQVIESWMNSEGHRENILSLNVWEIGTGYFQGAGQYSRYWAADFGKRANVYPLIIDREALTTSSRTVELYVYGAWTDIRVRVNGGDWSMWLPFQAPMPWTLPDVIGNVTIEVEVRSGSTTTTSSDTIYVENPEDLPVRAFLPMLRK